MNFFHRYNQPLVGRARILGESEHGLKADIDGEEYEGVPVVGGTAYEGTRPTAGFQDHLGRRQPFIMGEQQAREPILGARDTDVWSRALSGNARNTFDSLAGKGSFPAVSAVSQLILAQHQGVNWGAGSLLAAYRSGGRTMLAVLSETTGGQILYVFDVANPAFWFSNQKDAIGTQGDGITPIPGLIADSGGFAAGSFAPTHTHQQGASRLFYAESTDELILNHGQIRVVKFAASTKGAVKAGSITLDKAFQDGIVFRIGGLAGDVLVGLEHSWSLDGALRRGGSATPSAAVILAGSMRAYKLSDATLQWSFDPMELFTGTGVTYPMICNSLGLLEELGTQGAGNLPAYAPKEKVIFGISKGRDGTPLATPAATWPAAFSVANSIPANYVQLGRPDNRPFVFDNRENGVSPDASAIRAWLFTLDATGNRRDTYAFPALRPEENNLVDNPSFALNPPASYLDETALVGEPYNRQGYKRYLEYQARSQTAVGLLEHGSIDMSAGTLPTAGHPAYGLGSLVVGSLSDRHDTTSAGWLTVQGGGVAPGGGWQATVGGQQFLYPHWKTTWPTTANYYFDSCCLIRPRPVSGFTGTYADSPVLTVDVDENVYVHYLQPVKIVSGQTRKTGKIWAVHQITEVSRPTDLVNPNSDDDPPTGVAGPFARPPGWPGGGSIAIQWFAFPNVFVMYRSFLASFSKRAVLRWQVETTKYATDAINSSGLSLPFGSHVFKMLPTKAGVYILRTERVSNYGLPIIHNSARWSNLDKPTLEAMSVADDRIGDHEPLVYAKLVLEFRSRFGGAASWTRTLWEPTVETPTCIPAAYMFLDNAGNVQGRFDRATATWGSSGPTLFYSNYLLSAVVGTMFRADKSGNVTTRPATLSDPQAAGINQAPDNKARVTSAHCVLDGTLYANTFSPPPSPGLNKWVISKLAVGG